jgi:hypothetical protein
MKLGITAAHCRQAERVRLMSIQEISAEQPAELFHHYNHALAHELARQLYSRHQSSTDVPVEESNRMTAAARLALLELGSFDTEPHDGKYLAKPGEAEWGC